MRPLAKISEQDLARIQMAAGQCNLDPDTLEKDLHVLRIIDIVRGVPLDGCQTLFCGGTALSKAHHLLERMSEDVDFKLGDIDPDRAWDRDAREAALGDYLARVAQALEDAGYSLQEDDGGKIKAMRGNRYAILQVAYDTATPSHTVSLRNFVKVEINYTQVNATYTQQTVGSLVDRFLQSQDDPQYTVACLNLRETVAEKMVAFARRLAHFHEQHQAADALAGDLWDHSLVRHLYDLHMIKDKRPDIFDQELRDVLGRVITKDQEGFKNQHPAFAENPQETVHDSLVLLADGMYLRQQYTDFIQDMVYGDPSKQPSYAEAVNTFRGLWHDYGQVKLGPDTEVSDLEEMPTKKRPMGLGVHLIC